MVYNGYYKVMSNIPKMGQLPTPVMGSSWETKQIRLKSHQQNTCAKLPPESISSLVSKSFGRFQHVACFG
jgi:hypothetical protein